MLLSFDARSQIIYSRSNADLLQWVATLEGKSTLDRDRQSGSRPVDIFCTKSDFSKPIRTAKLGDRQSSITTPVAIVTICQARLRVEP